MNAERDGPSDDHLVALRGEVSRIADELAEISSNHELGLSAHLDGPPIFEISAETVRLHIKARRLRERYFDGALFAEPAWDMLLDLFEQELRGHRVAVSSACVAAAVPQSTALRWIKVLVEKGLFIRRDDPLDARRVFVELSPHASLALRHYFAVIADDIAD